MGRVSREKLTTSQSVSLSHRDYLWLREIYKETKRWLLRLCFSSSSSSTYSSDLVSRRERKITGHLSCRAYYEDISREYIDNRKYRIGRFTSHRSKRSSPTNIIFRWKGVETGFSREHKDCQYPLWYRVYEKEGIREKERASERANE